MYRFTCKDGYLRAYISLQVKNIHYLHQITASLKKCDLKLIEDGKVSTIELQYTQKELPENVVLLLTAGLAPWGLGCSGYEDRGPIGQLSTGGEFSVCAEGQFVARPLMPGILVAPVVAGLMAVHTPGHSRYIVRPEFVSGGWGAVRYETSKDEWDTMEVVNEAPDQYPTGKFGNGVTSEQRAEALRTVRKKRSSLLA